MSSIANNRKHRKHFTTSKKISLYQQKKITASAKKITASAKKKIPASAQKFPRKNPTKILAQNPHPRKIFRKKSFVHVNIYKTMGADKIIETIIDLPKSTDDCTHPTLEELDGSIFCTECGVETDRGLRPSRNRVWEKRIRR